MPGHAGADDRDVGLLGRGFVDDAAAEDDGDAIGEREQFVEVLADQQDGRARVSRGQDPVVDLGDGREVKPEDRIGRDQHRHRLG
jgi:hypothetical protein